MLLKKLLTCFQRKAMTIPIGKLSMDIGAESREEVEHGIEVGDLISFKGQFQLKIILSQ
jgi:putative aminopeptidase FrvX